MGEFKAIAMTALAAFLDFSNRFFIFAPYLSVLVANSSLHTCTEMH